jgi:hypothetical protein
MLGMMKGMQIEGKGGEEKGKGKGKGRRVLLVRTYNVTPY